MMYLTILNYLTEDYNYCNISSSEDDESDDFITQEPFNDHLWNWAVSYNINVAVTALLNILIIRHCFKNLPKDSRTLLKTSVSTKKVDVKNVDPGIYDHFGIAKCVKQFYPIVNHINDNYIKLVFGIIDGFI